MTNNFQRIEIVGRVGRDPVRRAQMDGTFLTEFTVAVETFYFNAQAEKEKSACWFQINAYEKLGDICHQYLKTGRLVYVDGKLEFNKFGNPRSVKITGTDRAIFEICADRVLFLDSPKTDPDPVQPEIDFTE